MKSEIMDKAIALYLESENLLLELGDNAALGRIAILHKAKAADDDVIALGYIRGLFG